MAKTRRGLSSIARGVEERLKNALNFGSKRKREVLNDLREEGLTEEQLAALDEELRQGGVAPSPISTPVPSVEGVDQEVGKSMHELASNIYRLNKVEEMRTMFNLLISNYNKELSENPLNADEIKEKLEAKLSQLEEFDREIEIIKLEEQIMHASESANNILDYVEKYFDELIDSLDKNDYTNITAYTTDIISKLTNGIVTPSGYTTSTLESNLDFMLSAFGIYKNLTGEEYDNPQAYINFFTENNVKKLYGEFESKIRQAQKELGDPDIEEVKADSLRKMIIELDHLISALPNLMKDPNNFEKLKAEIDKALDKTFGERQPIQHPTSTPEPAPAPQPAKARPTGSGSTSLFLVMVEQKVKKIYNKIRELSGEFKATDKELQDLLDAFEQDIAAVTYLDEETKNRIVTEAQERYNKKLMQEFGEDLYYFIEEYAFDYYEKQGKLNNTAYGTPEFIAAYKDLIDCINAMKIAGAKSNINVTFDEDNKMLTIDFNNDAVKTFKSQIVSNEVLEQMKKHNPEENENTKETALTKFTVEAEKLMAEYYKYLEKLLVDLETNDNIRDINIKINDLINDDVKYPELSLTERKDIVDDISEKNWNGLVQRYGEGFIDFVDRVLLNWYQVIKDENIDGVEFGTPEFEQKYENILNHIDDFKRDVMLDSEASNFIQQISFDEETQTLKIEYKNSKIRTYEKQIVSDEILKHIKAAKAQPQHDGAPLPPTPPAPPVPPVPPVPRPQAGQPDALNNSGYVAAKDEYISKLNELNSIIEMINDLNSRLESQAIFNFLDVNNAKNTIQLEEEAKELDQKMMSLKIELSKDRLNIKKQFNVFVINLPEVKSIAIDDVKFSGSLNDFITQRDEMIVEAENRIIELAEERKRNPQNISSINEEINTLLQFIETQNSIIGRRLVSDCKTNNINIVDTLRERRENKKDIRARLQEIKNEKVEPAPEPQPSSNIFADKYRRSIMDILQKELNEHVVRTRISFECKKPSENLSTRCQEAIETLDRNPYYTSVDKDQIKNEEFINLNYVYQNIIEVEQIVVLGNLYSDIYRVFDSINIDDVREPDFASKLNSQLQSLVKKYPTIDELKIELNLENNECSLEYNTRKFSFGSSTYKFKREFKNYNRVLEVPLFIEYNKSKNQQPQPAQEEQNITDFDTIYKYTGLYIMNQCGISNAIPTNIVNYELYSRNIDITNISAVLDKLEQDGVIRIENGFILPNMTIENFLKLTKGEKLDEPSPAEHKDQLDEQNEKITQTEVKISARSLTFNPKMEKQLANKGTAVIMEGDSVTISLIKNGIKIKYSQELREKLSKLNAKISLVNKENYRSRTTRTIDEAVEEQELSFSDERELSPEDYKIEVRVPNNNQSEMVFEYDLADASEELRGRSK